jgi:hypothetical protein
LTGQEKAKEKDKCQIPFFKLHGGGDVNSYSYKTRRKQSKQEGVSGELLKWEVELLSCRQVYLKSKKAGSQFMF